MPVVSMKELLEAGVHFGHQTRRWNPKMKRFIFTERGGIYIIDLTQTQELLDEAYNFAKAIAERGGSVLFVGTKKQAQDAVRDEATRVGMPYVNHRWLGGLLTNWRTISDRIQRLHELRGLKQESKLDLLPAKERIPMEAELEKLEANLGGVADMRRQPDADLHRRPAQGAARRARGAPARPAGDRARRHELRPGRGRVRDPGQRRRDPLVLASSSRRSPTASRPASRRSRENELKAPQGGAAAEAARQPRRRPPRPAAPRPPRQHRQPEPVEPPPSQRRGRARRRADRPRASEEAA